MIVARKRRLLLKLQRWKLVGNDAHAPARHAVCRSFVNKPGELRFMARTGRTRRIEAWTLLRARAKSVHLRPASALRRDDDPAARGAVLPQLAHAFCLRMILFENRFPLFGIMRRL
jgi:hypothetical protein